MADIERMKSALRNAHNAGDTAAAKKIANAIKAAQTLPDESQPAPNAAPIKPIDPYADRARRELDKMQGQGITAITAPTVRLPFNDNLAAIGGTIPRMISDQVGPGEAYQRQLAFERERERRTREESPIGATIGDIAGGVAAGGILTKGGLTLAGRALPGVPKSVSNVGGLMAEGAAYGAAMGVDEANGEDIKSKAIQGAAMGAALAPVTLAGAKAVDKVGGALAKRGVRKTLPAAPTKEDLAEQGHALYEAANRAGVSLRPKALNKAAQNVAVKLKARGFDKDLQPDTAVVFRKLANSADKPMTLTELENIRVMASTARREAAKGSDKSAAGIIVDEIDSLINKTGNFSANSGPALKSLQSAREVWLRKLRVEALEEINEKALNQATGYENGLVTQLRSLANNKKRLALFSKEEQALIKNAVRRGGVRGILKAFGMLSPTSTFGGITTGGALAGSGILPGMALGATGFTARKGAEALTRSQFNTLQDAAARGFTISPPANFRSIAEIARPVVPAASGGVLSGR